MKSDFKPPRGIEIQQLNGGAVALLNHDKMATTAPLYAEFAKSLDVRFNFSGMLVQADEQSPVGRWEAHKASVDLDGRTVLVNAVVGMQRRLVLWVENESSSAARAALEKIWRALCEIVEEEHVGLSQIGSVAEYTAAVVKLQVGFESVFPTTGVLRDELQRSLTEAGFQVEESFPRIGFDLKIKLGRQSIADSFRFEHRLGTDPKENVFYTSSPLPTKVHFDILGALLSPQ